MWPLSLVLFLAISLQPIMTLAQSCNPHGDVNLDSRLTPTDALHTLRHVLGIATLDACAQRQANVVDPAEAAITPADSLCIFQAFLHLSSC